MRREVQDIQPRLAAHCCNVSESTDLLGLTGPPEGLEFIHIAQWPCAELVWCEHRQVNWATSADRDRIQSA